MNETLPFDQWPTDPFQRGYEAEDALGKALTDNLKGQMQFIKKKCDVIAPALAGNELDAVIKEAAFGGIYALLMVLDGVAPTSIDAEHGIQWSLQAQIQHYGAQTNSVEVSLEQGGKVTLSSFRPADTKQVETLKVLPEGDGLCYAFHSWKEGYDPHD